MTPFLGRKSSRDTFTLAGWLFADLFLGLAMVFLISNTQAMSVPTTTPIPVTQSPSMALGGRSATRAAPTATPRPLTATPTPSPTPTVPVGIEQQALIVRVQVQEPSRLFSRESLTLQHLREDLTAQFSAYEGRRAGIVITEGNMTSISEGVRLAEMGNAVLEELFPRLFRGAVKKAYWRDPSVNSPAGTLTFEVFLFSEP